MGRKPETLPNHLPGEAGVWIIVAGDLLVFTVMFFTYFYYRALQASLFERSHTTLHFGLGLLNTLLMIASSLLVALAMVYVRRGNLAAAAWLLGSAVGCAAAFAGVKVIEWSDNISQAGKSIYFTLYFTMTGIHLLHVLVGALILALFVRMLRGLHSRRSAPNSLQILLIESGGIFWHVVDLLWIILFALFYLIG